MNPFTILTSKIFGGIALVLLVVVGLLWWQNGNLKAEVETQRTIIADRDASIRVQNAAIARDVAEGERQRQAFTAAVTAGNAALIEARAQRLVVTRTVRNGCPTPPVIMGAGL